MLTTILWCVVADIEAPFAHPGPGSGKRVPVEVGDWFAWVEEELADLVRDLLRAGFRPLRESWSRTARPGEFEVSIRQPTG